jgi:hypothetical protein
MPGVPKELIEHTLNVHPKATPKKQCLRRFAHDKREAIKREIAKLLAAGFIKEVIHPEWVVNPVLVKKKNNEWRMCVDYTDLNKHCPKDHFGLPRIDHVVNSTAGCVLLCYSGYHQIALKEEDQIKIAFITPYETYAYKTMSFGLKNAGATYQRVIQICFADLSVFNRLPTEGYAQGGKFWVRRRGDQELEGARNTKLRQVRAARCVTPYVLYGGLYCLWCRMT